MNKVKTETGIITLNNLMHPYYPPHLTVGMKVSTILEMCAKTIIFFINFIGLFFSANP